jgi:hypothetical protein
MFRRLVIEDSTALVTIIAFLTAATIYAAFAWRALRMKPSQLTHFSNLPFATPTPATPGVAPTSPVSVAPEKS